MMRIIAPISAAGTSHGGSFVRTALETIGTPVRSFAALMQRRVAHARSHAELVRLDARTLQDIGLEPFEVYYRWRGPACKGSRPSRFFS